MVLQNTQRSTCSPGEELPGLRKQASNLAYTIEVIEQESIAVLQQCGLKKETSAAIAKRFISWVTSNGPEWANSRWKDLRLWYETWLNGRPVIPPWFKHRRGMPTGCLRHIFLLPIDKALLALSINTLLVISVGSLPRQIEKVCHGISGNGYTYSTEKQEKVLILAEVGRSHLPESFRRKRHKFSINIGPINQMDLAGKQSVVVNNFHFPIGHRNNSYLGALTSLPRTTPKISIKHKKGKKSTKVQLIKERFCRNLPLLDEKMDSLVVNGQAKVHKNGDYSITDPSCFISQSQWDSLLIASAYLAVPSVTKDYLLDHGLQTYLSPDAYIGISSDWQHYDEGQPFAGKISFIQEPQLKLRTVVNGDLMTQKCLEPLGNLWYNELRSIGYDEEGNRDVSCIGAFRDCTFNQDAGVLWIQKQLNQGREMAGTDLTSATDLISVEAAIDLINHLFFPDLLANQDYLDTCKLFVQLAKSPYYSTNQLVRTTAEHGYGQGQGMGFYPSFALLGLVNNAASFLSNVLCDILPYDSYTTLGDDECQYPEATPAYKSIMCDLLGCEINDSKTIRGSMVAEFAGRVITTDDAYLKATKLQPVTDSNFMSQQAKRRSKDPSLLQPRQRKVWETFKYVPGILVPGSEWSQDSFGEPLYLRYLWWYTIIQGREEGGTLPVVQDEELNQLNLMLRAQELVTYESEIPTIRGLFPTFMPFTTDQVVRETTPAISDNTLDLIQMRNKRLEMRKLWEKPCLTLRQLERLMKSPSFQSYEDFKKSHTYQLD
jgi:hypothetical protein